MVQPITFSQFLNAEWRPALGCTEPASIAYAAASASALVEGSVLGVHLTVDPRMFKNCYAVGIPHSGGQTGILWATGLGALIPDASAGLEVFRQVTPDMVNAAESLVKSGGVTVDVDSSHNCLYVDCRVVKTGGIGRAVLAEEHTRLIRLELNGNLMPVPEPTAGTSGCSSPTELRRYLAERSFEELVEFSKSVTASEVDTLFEGALRNQAIAHHGLTLFPRRFFLTMGDDSVSRLSRLVFAGVYARMSGEDFTVMSLSGSGNKGITVSVPLSLWGEDHGHTKEHIGQAMALAALVTSATTHHLGTLSAVCGCSNAAGTGLAAGLVALEGGTAKQISLAMNNMVGNVAGMICDGAKIGCALKTMTSVDAAFRAASLALSDIGIPESDGVVGRSGEESLRNLGRIAVQGMMSTDTEILRIMQEKLRRPA